MTDDEFENVPKSLETTLHIHYSSTLPPSEPPPTLPHSHNLSHYTKLKVDPMKEKNDEVAARLFTSRSTSYDADTEELYDVQPSSGSVRSVDTPQFSRNVEIQTDDTHSQKAYVKAPSKSPQCGRIKTTRNLHSPVPPPVPPRSSPPKSTMKKTGSVNWLDRSSSIVDLQGLFEEVNQSREAIHKSRESLHRSSGKSSLSVHIPMSRTKSVSNLQHAGLAGAKESGLSKSSWELSEFPSSPPTFHPLRAANSISFDETYKHNLHSSSPKIKRSPALRRITGEGRLGDSVYHTVHSPSGHVPPRTAVAHRSVNSSSVGRPATPFTPAFQEDVYYTIQGAGGVTQHYQTEEVWPWQHMEPRLGHRKKYYYSSSASSEDGYEEDPMYKPLRESSGNVSPSEEYSRYAQDIPCYSPRSSKHLQYHHSPPQYIPHYPPMSPKSPKHHHFSPKSHRCSHSPHQVCPSSQCSSQSSHYHTQPYYLHQHQHQLCPQCSPQSPHYQPSHYPRACMHQNHPYPLSSRPWPSPTAQLEMSRSFSWTVSSCTGYNSKMNKGKFYRVLMVYLSLSVWGHLLMPTPCPVAIHTHIDC